MSAETSFTPGPWFVDEEDGGYFDIRSKGRTWPIVGSDGADCIHNARLIAASPELYKQLSHLVRLLEPLEESGALAVPGLATLNGARAALKKARGEV